MASRTKNLSLCSSDPHHLRGKNSGNLSSLLTEIIYYHRGNKDCLGYKWVVTFILEDSGPTNCTNRINLIITNFKLLQQLSLKRTIYIQALVLYGIGELAEQHHDQDPKNSGGPG